MGRADKLHEIDHAALRRKFERPQDRRLQAARAGLREPVDVGLPRPMPHSGQYERSYDIEYASLLPRQDVIRHTRTCILLLTSLHASPDVSYVL